MRKYTRMIALALAAPVAAIGLIGTAASAPAASYKPAAATAGATLGATAGMVKAPSAIPPGHYTSDQFVQVDLGASPDIKTAERRVLAVKPQLRSTGGVRTLAAPEECVTGELAHICGDWDIWSPPDGPTSWHIADIHQWNVGGQGQLSFQIRTHGAHIMWNQLANDGVTRCMFDDTPPGDSCGTPGHNSSEGWFAGYYTTTLQVCVKDVSSGSRSTYVLTPYAHTIVGGSCSNFPNGG